MLLLRTTSTIPAFARPDSLPSLIGRLVPLLGVAFGQPREQELVVTSAASESQIMLLREVDGRSDLDGKVWPGEGLIKVHPAEHAGAPPGAIVQNPLG